MKVAGPSSRTIVIYHTLLLRFFLLTCHFPFWSVLLVTELCDEWCVAGNGHGQEKSLQVLSVTGNSSQTNQFAEQRRRAHDELEDSSFPQAESSAHMPWR
jgi:hypothetical protein